MEKQAHEAEEQIVDPVLDNPIDAKTNKTLYSFLVTGVRVQASPKSRSDKYNLGYRLEKPAKRANPS